MGLFDKNTNIPTNLNFNTRAEAFNYMLNYMLNTEKVGPMEAAEKANQFAEIFATNAGLPLTVEPELKGVDKYISMAEKIGTYIEQHPKVVEYGIPALTFIAGLFTGKKVEQIEDNKPHWNSIQNPNINQPNQQQQSCDNKQEGSIDFDKID